MTKTGLVLEGGGMRGLFTAGVIDEMMTQGIHFDGIVGVSAGATFGCNYKSHQIGRVLRYNLTFRKDPRYMGLRSLVKTGDLVGAEFSYHVLPTELDVFDYKTFEEDPSEFHIVCTDVATGKAVYKQLYKMDYGELEWLRASASLPGVSNPVEIGGQSYLDGGMADSIPLQYFQQKGFGRNIVVLTQPKGFKKKRPSIMPLIKVFCHKYPKIVDALANRHLMYNAELDYISEQEQLGNTMLIYPDAELPIGRVEQNPDKMKNVYEMGRTACRAQMMKIKEFLSAKE